MSETKVLLDLVQRELDGFCATRKTEFTGISEDLSVLVDYTKELLAGGKRFRALFCYWAWVAALDVSSTQQDSATRARSTEAMVGICSALEMFHGAALVHDDLLDQSDTRRGVPAVHKRFESMHAQHGWAGSPERFGQAGSVLVGDLMLAWSSEIFGIEVMAGQYLDVLEENAAPTRAVEEAVGRANRVILYKTAKYSIEAPLLIGAAFAGADPAVLRGLSAFGIPLGMAFQLRDDILGVFGDPAVTGKPAGDDLREGKRTVLVGLTRESLTPTVGKIFDELLTHRELDAEQIAFLQQTIKGSGALAKTESMIEELANESLLALDQLQLDPTAMMQLRELAVRVINRQS